MLQQIIAIGGGGFSIDGAGSPLDRYILAQAPKERPIVTFVPTASGDSEGYVARFLDAFRDAPCEPRHVSLFRGTGDPRAAILESDIVYVGGGNTKNMLALWREWDLIPALKTALNNGTILCGVSAGAICWFDSGSTDSVPGRLTTVSCIGFLSGSACPHYLLEPARKETYPAMVASGELPPGYAIDDDVALHFIDGTLHRVVASKPNRRAYFIGSDGRERVFLPEVTG